MSLLRTNGSNKKKKHGGISLNNSNLSTPLISPSRNTHEHRNKRKSHNKKMGIFAKQRESKEKARNLWGKFRRDTGGLGLGKAAFKSSSLSSLINSINVDETKVNIPSNDMESKGGDNDENDKMEKGLVIEERDETPPKSMRELLVNDHKIEQAAVLIMDSWAGNSEHHGFSHESVILYKFLHEAWWYNLYIALVVLYLIAGLLPRNDLKSNFLIVSIIECIILLCLSYDIFLMWKVEKEDVEDVINNSDSSSSDDDEDEEVDAEYYGSGTFCGIRLPDKWTTLRGFIILLFIADFTMYVITTGESVRWSTFARPLMLVLRAQALRIVFVGCLYAGMRILRVLFLIACDVVFFGFVGFVLFSKVAEEKGFETPFAGMRTMLLILTAPGTVLADMEPLQRHSDGWASLFFILFVIVTTMIFQKLVLATAYRSYKGYQKRHYYQRLANSTKAATDAFYLIAIEDEVDKLNWRRVFDNLKGGHHSMIADTIFDSIDEEYSFVPGNGLIELEPFRKLCEMSQHAGPALKHLELHDHHELTTYERFQKSLRQCMNTEIHLCSVKGYAKHTGLTIVVVGLFVDILVLVSIVQLYMSVTYPSDESWKSLGIIILGLFTLEVTLKMIAYGVKKYMSFGEHVLDAFCVAAGIIFFTYESVSKSQGGTLYNLALVLRTLRVLKFLWLSETLHGLLWTIIRLGDSLIKLFFILFVPVYSFATVAQQIFGTTVTFHGSEAAKATKWYAVRSELNFETGMNSMRTLFEITTVSSWNMVMEAADILYGNKRYTFWVELFFFSFRIIMTMMFVPILTGFLIESFVTSFDTYEKHHKHKKGEIEDVTKQHEMELRILNTNPGKLEEITKLKNSATVTHDKHKVVKQILEDRATMADTEKKIYGVDTQIKDALIRSLRNAKVRLEGQLKLKDAAVMKHQKTIMNVNRESRRLSNINETLRYEMKKRQLRTRATSAPPPPPRPQEKIVEDAVSEILAISVVPKEPPMPPAEEEDERSRLSSSPVDEALL